MKITVTGPHCSGKTTILRHLVDSLAGTRLKFIPNKINPPFDLNDSNRLKQDSDLATRVTYWMIAATIQKEIEHESPVLFDRGIIDQIVYPSVIFGSEANIPRGLYHLAIDWLQRFPADITFVLPANFAFLKAGGLRDKTEGYLREVDEAYKRIVPVYCKNYHFLPPCQEEQIKILETYINQESFNLK